MPARLPALDGLRALAVLGVVAFHDGRLVGGYLGVDLFFVLSGFLITRNLLVEHASTGRIDLRAFWVRRARRLFPALLAVVVAVALVACVLASPAERARVRADGLATLGYVANWHAIAAGQSYWDLFSAPSPFAHAWSLAIEEQFYLVWPLVAWLALRAARPRRSLGLVALALGLGSAAALARTFEHLGSDRAYLGTDTRAAALLAGAALACALHGRRPLGRRAVALLDVLGVAALVALAFAWVRLEGHDPFVYRGGLWLTEVAVLVLLVCASEPTESRVARVLAARPLVAIGVVSYGIYLVHWPIFVALAPGRFGLVGAKLTLVRLALTTIAAFLSYRHLEEPIRRRGLPFGRPALVVPAAFAVAAGALVVGSDLAPPPRIDPVARTMIAPPPETASDAPRVLVVGDSVALTLGERMVVESRSAHVSVFPRGVVECSVLDGEVPTRSVRNLPHRGGNCAAHWNADVDEVRPDVTLVVLGGAFLASARVDGRWRFACDPRFQDAYARALTDRLRALGPRAGSVVLARVPRPTGAWDNPKARERVRCFDDLVDDVARRVPQASLLDLAAHVCPDGCALESDGEPVRPDGLHFRGHGADATAEWVLERLPLRARGPQSRRWSASQASPAL
jgi:peptidoglycan/LPS O-acetylase OafA/YrhL